MALNIGGCNQPWSDVYVAGRWRIQRRAGREAYRLLEANRCRIRGDLETCRAAIRQESKSEEAGPPQEAVLLLHGILRTSRCFLPMSRKLTQSGFAAFPIDYASTQLTIEQAADDLQLLLAGMSEYTCVHLVGHSMGGLVIRAWFRKYGETASSLGRVVMLGTPNHGAELAEWLGPTFPYRWLFGPAGQQLRHSEFVDDQRFATPTVPFGLIAGGRGSSRGYNPLLPGDNDGTVTVDSVRLDGAADFLLIKSPHMLMMRNKRAMAAVERFLRDGRFAEQSEQA